MNAGKVHFFSLPNLATDEVEILNDPWNVKVDDAVLALPTREYKRRWRDASTKHWLLLLVEGRDPTRAVSSANPAAVLHGFAADYDSPVGADQMAAFSEKPPSRYRPAWWSLSHGGKLHLFWLLDRPVSLLNNTHAAKLMEVMAAKMKVALWGAGYDKSSEKPTQVIDIGREWHAFDESARVPADEVILWDAKLFERECSRMMDERIDVPFDAAVAEIRKREWPHPVPADIAPGTRCVRFWDPDADNATGAQFTQGGLRVYTPHDNGFVSWKTLLGSAFCEEYTAKSMAPFYEDTMWLSSKDVYWRFLRDRERPHFEPRSEKNIRSDMVVEAGLSDKAPRGEELSEVGKAIKTIQAKNSVQYVAPLLYEPAGRIYSEALGGDVLNISTVTLKAPAKPTSVTDADVKEYDGLPSRYVNDPLAAEWDNYFAVRDFPHIHRLLTCYFARGKSAYDKWIEGGARPEKVLKVADEQLPRLLSWMSHFYNDSTRRVKSTGQALVIAGPASTGKSFFASQLLAQLMGGGDNGKSYYIENNRFTGALANTPVHYIDDCLGTLTKHGFKGFTERLKTAVALQTIRYEEKFGSAVNALPWHGRVVILSNLDPQSLSVIPSLEQSTEDKFMMLRFSDVRFEFCDVWADNLKWLAEELPHFARFLRMYEIPVQFRDPRFGVKAWQHPELRRASLENGTTPVILEAIFDSVDAANALRDPKKADDPWAFRGTLNALYRWLTSSDPTLAREFDRQDLGMALKAMLSKDAYNLEYSEEGRTWKIAYDFAKKS